MVGTKKVERLLRPIQTLQAARSLSVAELAALAGVSRRTVFRDLELLGRAGLQYSYDKVARRYSPEKTKLLPPVTLTHADALALVSAARDLVQGGIYSDENAATSVGLKLESMLPPAIQDYCGPLLERMEIRPDPASESAAIHSTLSILQTALVKQRKIRASYDSYHEGRVIDVTLRPYRLAYLHRGWYLIAFRERLSEIQTYKVERILSLKLLVATYSLDPDFTLDDYFGKAWLMIRGDTPYHVKVRFLPKVAGNVDEIYWHKTQQTMYEKDGSLVYDVDVDGIDEISWWILGYGDQARVLEPPELRTLIAQRVKRMAEYYDGEARASKDQSSEV